MSEAEERLNKAGWKLPELRQPIGIYRGAIRMNNLLFVSGHGPIVNDERVFIGKVGADLTIDDGRRAAEIVMLNALRTIKEELGDLDLVRRVLKVTGYVNSDLSFRDQPQVIDAASQVLIDAFGERGRGARTALGMYILPFGIAVEIELILEVEDPDAA